MNTNIKDVISIKYGDWAALVCARLGGNVIVLQHKGQDVLVPLVDEAQLKVLGIESESEPYVEDDINYISRVVPQNTVEASASKITLDEGQKGAKPTELRSVQDPSPLSECHDARSLAYERDAQLIKSR